MKEKYDDLLRRIAEEYSIRRGEGEEESSWTVRIIYSYLGQMALASLFDRPEEGEVSIVHVKRRIERILESFRRMYPELKDLLSEHASNNTASSKDWKLSDEIYDIYQNTGCIYHRGDHVMTAAASDCVADGIRFLRGHALGERKNLSGLGSYQVANEPDSTFRLEEMFQMEQISPAEIWDLCVENADFRLSSFETSQMWFLRTEPPIIGSYWIKKPGKSGTAGLMRTDSGGKQIYYLYRYEGSSLRASQLPDWQVQNSQYLVLANGCLMKEGVLPPARFRDSRWTVSLHFGYLPPPAELNLWKLYSWPEDGLSGLKGKNFDRICDRRVFQVIRGTMENLGYRFEEVK